MWFYVVCNLEGWVIVSAVDWVDVIYLLCEGFGTIVLWDGGGEFCVSVCIAGWKVQHILLLYFYEQ